MTEIQEPFSGSVGESAAAPLPGAPRSIPAASDEAYAWPADALERLLKAIRELDDPMTWLPEERKS